MIVRKKYYSSVPYFPMQHSPFSGFRSRWRTWYLPIASALPLIRAPPALLRSAGQWQWCRAWVIWRNIFQILSSCNETPERVAFRIREPRSPDLQYWSISFVTVGLEDNIPPSRYISSHSLGLWSSELAERYYGAWALQECYYSCQLLSRSKRRKLTPQLKSASCPSLSFWNNQAVSTHIPSHHPLFVPWK